jgi:hypothetical protein
MKTKTDIQLYDEVRIELPHSEVCMYMKVACKVMTVQLLPDSRNGGVVAQLRNEDGSDFSFPIGTGEAGIYTEYVNDHPFYYCYVAPRSGYISVYSVDRCYGGPEEGGWWYNRQVYENVSEPITVTTQYVGDCPVYNAAKERLLKDDRFEQPRHDIYSMANEGPQYETRFETELGSEQTVGKPHYE